LEAPDQHLPLFFRAATMVGCAALLLGVAGIFYFGVRDRTAREIFPTDATTVLLRGLAPTDDVVLQAYWSPAEGEDGSEMGQPGEESGHWYFHRAPAGVALTLTVYRRPDGGARERVHQQHAIFTRGAAFEVYVRER
jgi:hypothetical protein